MITKQEFINEFIHLGRELLHERAQLTEIEAIQQAIAEDTNEIPCDDNKDNDN